MDIFERIYDSWGLSLEGVVLGACTFLIIGIFHPLVIKGEYYFGERCKWWFFAAGIVTLAAALAVREVFWSGLLGVVSFSCFWSIKEVKEQTVRVKRGWFPRNPKRTYPWDNQPEEEVPSEQ